MLMFFNDMRAKKKQFICEFCDQFGINSGALKHSHSYGASFNETQAKKKRFIGDMLG